MRCFVQIYSLITYKSKGEFLLFISHKEVKTTILTRNAIYNTVCEILSDNALHSYCQVVCTFLARDLNHIPRWDILLAFQLPYISPSVLHQWLPASKYLTNNLVLLLLKTVWPLRTVANHSKQYYNNSNRDVYAQLHNVAASTSWS